VRRSATPAPGGRPDRSARLRAPLLIALWVLLSVEAVGGLVIFCVRVVNGAAPGVTLHTAAGVALSIVYAAYQWRHWLRVRPVRPRLDYGLGLIAAGSMVLAQASGVALAWIWWSDTRGIAGRAAEYPATLSAFHNIASMVVLTFVGAHLGAVLARARPTSESGPS
jgi:hypothetical protein